MSKVTPREITFSPVLNLSCPHSKLSIHKHSKDPSGNPECPPTPHQPAGCFLFLHYPRGLNNFQLRSPVLDFCYLRMRLYPALRRGSRLCKCSSMLSERPGPGTTLTGERGTFHQANPPNSTPHPKPPRLLLKKKGPSTSKLFPYVN